MDHKGWYNRKDLQFMFIEDVTILSAMRPPGGGNPSITMRFLRHFNILAYTELSFKTITAIFSRMTKHFLKRF
jgi:dynein heavy chain